LKKRAVGGTFSKPLGSAWYHALIGLEQTTR
jgi:hypothetical protein